VGILVLLSTFCARSSFCQLPNIELEDKAPALNDEELFGVGIDRAGVVFVSTHLAFTSYDQCKNRGTPIENGAEAIAGMIANGVVTNKGYVIDSQGNSKGPMYPSATGVAVDSSGNVILINPGGDGSIRKYSGTGSKQIWTQSNFGQSQAVAVACDAN